MASVVRDGAISSWVGGSLLLTAVLIRAQLIGWPQDAKKLILLRVHTQRHILVPCPSSTSLLDDFSIESYPIVIWSPFTLNKLERNHGIYESVLESRKLTFHCILALDGVLTPSCSSSLVWSTFDERLRRLRLQRWPTTGKSLTIACCHCLAHLLNMFHGIRYPTSWSVDILEWGVRIFRILRTTIENAFHQIVDWQTAKLFECGICRFR